MGPGQSENVDKQRSLRFVHASKGSADFIEEVEEAQRHWNVQVKLKERAQLQIEWSVGSVGLRVL